MLADEAPLLGLKRTGLRQDRLGDADLADVVQRRCAAKFVDRLAVHTQATSDPDRELCHTRGVIRPAVAFGAHDADEDVVRLVPRPRGPGVLVRVHSLVRELQCVVGGRRFVRKENAPA